MRSSRWTLPRGSLRWRRVGGWAPSPSDWTRGCWSGAELRGATFRPEIEIDGVKTRVMVEQLSVVDPDTRLGDFAGRLDAAELRALDAALLVTLGLD